MTAYVVTAADRPTRGMSRCVTVLTVVVLAGLEGSHVNNAAGSKLTLHGAGASFPSQVYQSWLVQYAAFRKPYVTLTLQYDAVGSGAGKARMKGLKEGYVDYVGSDSLLSEDDHKNYPDLRMFPTMAG